MYRTRDGGEGRRASGRGAEAGRRGRGRDDVRRREIVLDLAAARLSRAVDLRLVPQLQDVPLQRHVDALDRLVLLLRRLLKPI